MKTQYILTLNECTADRADRIGGKGLGLGILTNHGLLVPPGFTVTTDGYQACVATAGLTDRIAEILNKTENTREASARIEALFTEDMLTDEVAAAIEEAYEQMGGSKVAVAVRSSATAEDTAEASFAGQQETYLWVRGVAEVRRHVVRCWASLFTQRAIDYRALNKVPLEGLAMGVVVQQMVPAEAAGVIMTLHPVNGDRSQIYIESSYGLGEIVVRGEVDPDRFCVDKETLSIRSEEIGTKERAYHLDKKHNEVRLFDVPLSDQTQPSLSKSEVCTVGELAKRVEEHFGKPMDIEWAITTNPDNGTRELFLLQARPETIWSNRPEPVTAKDVEAVIGRHDDWDPLHNWSSPDVYWTTSILGEDIPGVATPLGWSLWSRATEYGVRECFYRIGVLTRAERPVPDRVEDRFVRMFYGRAGCQIKVFSQLGDRMPGMTGEQTAEGMFGIIPEDFEFNPTKRRYAIIAYRFPWTFLTAPALIHKVAREFFHWYQKTVARVPDLDLGQAVALFREAAERFDYGLAIQGIGVTCVVQPLYGALTNLAERTGVSLSALSTQSGGAELAVVSDIWKASRGEMEFEEVVRKHGFHGPEAGELSNPSWREDSTQLRGMLDQFAALDDSQSPEARDRENQRRRKEAERQAIDATPPYKRPLVRLLLKLARERLIFRGIAKESFLQGFDVCRACARRIGTLLADAGTINDPEDVFYLTAAELTGKLPENAEELVARRRQRRKVYEAIEVPTLWKGMPKVVFFDQAAGQNAEGAINGIGVSAGIVEGTAVVVMNPNTEIEPGQVLVAPTTDPAWSPIMFISKGLVVDIGGALSHAAVVSRELGIPCVVNTRNGTKALKTGDRVRVDGSKGTVEILE